MGETGQKLINFTERHAFEPLSLSEGQPILYSHGVLLGTAIVTDTSIEVEYKANTITLEEMLRFLNSLTK